MEDSDKIACCLICTISDDLKACSSCKFNAGLPFRLIKQNEALNADSLIRLDEVKERFVLDFQFQNSTI